VGIGGVLAALCAVGASYGLERVFDAGGEMGTLAVRAAVITLVVCGTFVPAAVVIDRGMRRAVGRIRGLAERGERGGVVGPFAMGWCGDELSAAAMSWADRCEDLDARLKEAEVRERVVESERHEYEAVLHSLKDAVIVTDEFNDIAMVNEQAGRLLGFEVSNALHKPVQEVVRDDLLTRQISETSRAGVISKQKRFEHSLTAHDEDGEGIHSFDVTLACLQDEDQDAVGGVVTILRDVTREKEISQMKSDFVSQASHELRTPLSSINAYIEMLIDGEADDEKSRDEFYQIIKSEADRVGRMIDNMLNISRIEAGIISADYEEVDFVKVVRDVLETMKPQASLKEIMLIEKSGPLVYTAEADRDMVYQVVMNLVSNAIKYTPDTGRVTVSVENDDASRGVLVSVSDTGLGIPPEAIGRLFEKFFRIDNYKRVAKGTGLGLNLVKQIVESVHRGTVGVTSEVGMGSRFFFTIPYDRDTL
jgi:PAS domain S-box-containing protein